MEKLSQRKFAEWVAEMLGMNKESVRYKLQDWNKRGILSPIEKQDKGKASYYDAAQLEEVKRLMEAESKPKIESAEEPTPMCEQESDNPSSFEGNAVEDTQAARADNTDADNLPEPDEDSEVLPAVVAPAVDNNDDDLTDPPATTNAAQIDKPVEFSEKTAYVDVEEVVPLIESLADLQDDNDRDVIPLEREKTIDTNADVPTPVETVAPLEDKPAIEETQSQALAVLGFDNRRLDTLDDYADFIRELNLRKEQYDAAFTILIGRMLIEAKKLAGHGKWAKWLAENKEYFGFSQQYANKFMSVADRWGNGELKDVFQFNRSQLFELLSIPQGEELEFIAAQADKGKPVEELPAREVQAAVKEWRKAKEPAPESLSSFENDSEEIGGVYGNILGKPSIDEVIADNEVKRSHNVEESSEDVPPDMVKKLPPIAHNQNGSVEWYTPAEIIEAARRVMGGIDLDPASSEIANQTVKAKNFFTADDNGLNHEWYGRIWLNPPFTKGIIEKFVDKILSSDIEAAIVLTDAATDTQWFRRLVDKCVGIVFTTGRINFTKEGNLGKPTRGQAIFYFGADAGIFFETFKQFGWCAKAL